MHLTESERRSCTVPLPVPLPVPLLYNCLCVYPRAVLAKHPHATVGVNSVLEAKVSVATDHLRQLAYISLCSSRYVACDSEVYASGMPSVHAFLQSCY